MSSGGGHDAAVLIAKFVRVAQDFGVLEDVCVALERGNLTPDCSAVTYAPIARGQPQVESALAGLLKVWRLAYGDVSGEAVALTLRACSMAMEKERLAVPSLEVVWTGPRVDGSFVRSTNEVVRELIGGARSELLVVGYWLIAREESAGPMAEIIERLSHAVQRGVSLTLILDERRRHDGRDNKSILLQVWPEKQSAPKLLTWKLPADDIHIKLHAKVLVADERDALITSANLTDYAMTKNVEMGVRLIGAAAAAVRRHFSLLEQDGVLTEL